jgi:hypothetical protein
MIKSKIIYIFLDIDASKRMIQDPLSYESVKREMKNGNPYITTNVTDFFTFDILEEGYDVIVLRYNNGNPEYILLSELLTPDHQKYTDKEVRFANNAHKMLMAGAFNFQPWEPEHIGESRFDHNSRLGL